MGRPATAEVAVHLNGSDGLIYSRALLKMTDAELLHELAPQGVTEVQRLAPKRRSPNPLIRLRFRGLTLPARIFCGYMAVEVRPWLPAPRQCRNCWQFGHPARTCRLRQQVCGRCAGEHSADDCSSEHPQCPNCKGDHSA